MAGLSQTARCHRTATVRRARATHGQSSRYRELTQMSTSSKNPDPSRMESLIGSITAGTLQSSIRRTSVTNSWDHIMTIARSILVCAVTAICLLGMTRSASAQQTQQDLQPSDLSLPELTPANYAQWRKIILGSDEITTHRQIPWHLSFYDGLKAAAIAHKPVFLWTMNGHPLGCT